MQLGAKVTAPGRILRQQLCGETNRKEWHKSPWKQKPIIGIYIGVRTYANGTIAWEEDIGNVFTADEWVKVALIVESARENPVPVLYEEMTLVK